MGVRVGSGARACVGPLCRTYRTNGDNTSPASPAMTTRSGSGTLKRQRSPRLARAIAAVGTSTIARCPRTTTAPAMAPLAAAVAPSEKARSCALLRWRTNQGAGMTVKHPDWQEDADGGQGRSREPGDQVADEGHGDDDRSRGDHGDGHRVEELLLGQPAVPPAPRPRRGTARWPGHCRRRTPRPW